MLIGVLPLSTTTTSLTTTTKKTITKTNQDGDKCWETRAGVQDADVSRAPGIYYFIHFLYYTNVLQVPQWQRTATTTTVMLTTHHSHLHVSNDPKITTTTKKATRVGRWGQGLEIQTHLESQVSFFYYFIHFLYYINVLQTMNMKMKMKMKTKVMRVGRQGHGLKMQTHLKPQVCFANFFTVRSTTTYCNKRMGGCNMSCPISMFILFFHFISFLLYKCLFTKQVSRQWRTATTTIAIHYSHLDTSNGLKMASSNTSRWP